MQRHMAHIRCMRACICSDVMKTQSTFWLPLAMLLPLMLAKYACWTDFGAWLVPESMLDALRLSASRVEPLRHLSSQRPLVARVAAATSTVRCSQMLRTVKAS